MSKIINASQLHAHIGSYFIPFLENEKTPAKLLMVEQEEKKVVYEVLAGAKKGQIWRGAYQELSNITIYSEENLVLALLQVGEKKK